MASSISGSSSQSTNEAANQSTVSGSGSITITVGNFYGMQSWGRVTIGGVSYDTPGPTSMSQGASWSWGSSRTFDHSANGERGSVDVSVSFWIDGTALHANSTGAGTQGALNYDRKPGAAGTVTASVNSDKSITVNVGNTSSLASSPTFKFSYSTDNGATWSADSDGTTTVVSGTTFTGQKVFSGLTPGATYLFRAYATNTDGNGATTTMSAGVFLMAGGKRWNGTAWVPLTVFKRWNGSAWVDVTTAQRWNGSAWVNLQ